MSKDATNIKTTGSPALADTDVGSKRGTKVWSRLLLSIKEAQVQAQKGKSKSGSQVTW